MILKRFSPALCLLLMTGVSVVGSASLHAGASNKSGNPFGNGTFFQNTGTFSAVVRGENLSGTMMFSTGAGTNSSSSSSSGSTTIFYAGYMYNGNAVGTWNPASGSITGQFWGGQTLSGSNGVTFYPEIYNSNYFPVAVNVISNTVFAPTAGTDSNGTSIIIPGTNFVTTNTIYVSPVGTNTFNDALYMSGSFDGVTQNEYPNQTFNAQGTVVQQQLYPQQAGSNANPPYSEGTVPVQMAAPLTIPVTVQGVRIADTYSSFSTISNSIPYTQTTYQITNINGL